MIQVLQIDEIDFRKAGTHTDELLSILKQRDVDIIDNKRMFIRTNLVYNHTSIVMKAFNIYLKRLRSKGVVAINVILDV